ncbi:MAG: hypothetical protein QOF56_3999 [Acidobacteriaceae bacterium]|jgi:hypothetical protein|nr:hypothetical protein [Acidobacteriaceae bacterium]
MPALNDKQTRGRGRGTGSQRARFPISWLLLALLFLLALIGIALPGHARETVLRFITL